MMGITALAGLLNRERKDEVALWLMGAQTEKGWAQSFTSLFDAVFGHRHLSPRCFLSSAAASLIAVFVIWLLMGSADFLSMRLQTQLSLGSVLILGLAINVAADYVSLLETRLLLGHMPRRTLAQAGVLILDLFLSAAIIWLAIFAFLRSPLHQGEIEDFAEVLGVFSTFSVFFYSTFLTSVWTWAYIASTWVMRLSSRLRLADWLDVEHRPILILSNIVGFVTFLGAVALSGPLTRDDQGITAADRALCSVFKGQVCLKVAELTPLGRTHLSFVVTACLNGKLEECGRDGDDSWLVKALEVRTDEAFCADGDQYACARVAAVCHRDPAGYCSEQLSLPAAEQAAQTACQSGVSLGCMIWPSIVEDHDPKRAARIYQRQCDAGDGDACAGLANIYDQKIFLPPQPTDFGTEEWRDWREMLDRNDEKTEALLRRACDLGHQSSCYYLRLRSPG